ncbi:wall-associated protein [Listeria grandensis FSL F6-0971]|uniref:Wall-associated protein n=1 Tax=Listeria grandensis FSL F6-0971 TaxID=1265819 RepID=W7B359_9LIST|nr:hypothetical protein [Listeria grandensis]EUJ21689.1 wall-associated protein [Listeria grandensis FSL F6-0971]
MKKGLSRLLLVTIAITMIVSTIPAYEPYAEQGVPPAEGTIEGTPEKTEVVEEQTENEQQDTQMTEDEKTEVSSVKVDGDWKDPYYEGKRMLRSVQDKPEKATIKTVSNGVGTGTGAMNLSWKAMPGATGYKVIIGNGYNYEYFSVGNVTSWTTKGKGIFPTKAELDKGLYRFHTDGKGTEFANDPTQLYENTFKAGTTWTLRGQKKYIVRILAIYASGDGPTSDITEAVMPPETLPAKPEKSTIKTVSNGAGTSTGYMDISWQAVSGAIDYKVVISNGYNYEYFNTGNVTNWSTKGKKIFPTQSEIANKQYKFHQDGKGVEFASDPRALYENGYQAGSTFGLRNQKKYIVRILAVYPWGDGPTSDITDASMPIEQMAKPTVTSYRSEEDASKGYLDVSWQPVADAISYKVGLFNGFNYQYVNVGKTTNWSTKGKKLWASKTDIANGNYQLHTDGTGSELPMDPMQTYTAANKANPNVNYSDRLFYYTRVIAVLADGEAPVSEAGVVTMPYKTIDDVNLSSRGIDDKVGAIDLYWNEVTGAQGYIVWVFDGLRYNRFDVETATGWTSQFKNVWSTSDEISQGKGSLHLDGEGSELTIIPSLVYKVNGSSYSDKNVYWTRVTAYDKDGQTIALNQNNTIEIEALPIDGARTVVEGNVVQIYPSAGDADEESEEIGPDVDEENGYIIVSDEELGLLRAAGSTQVSRWGAWSYTHIAVSTTVAEGALNLAFYSGLAGSIAMFGIPAWAISSLIGGASLSKYGQAPGRALAKKWDKNKNGWIGFYKQWGYNAAGKQVASRYTTK